MRDVSQSYDIFNGRGLSSRGMVRELCLLHFVAILIATCSENISSLRKLGIVFDFECYRVLIRKVNWLRVLLLSTLDALTLQRSTEDWYTRFVSSYFVRFVPKNGFFDTENKGSSFTLMRMLR